MTALHTMNMQNEISNQSGYQVRKKIFFTHSAFSMVFESSTTLNSAI
jgi:hypothetical protein